METSSGSVESLFERVESYGKTSYELAKLKSLQATTRVVSSLISRLSAILMLSLFLLVLNIGIALWLGEFLGKSYYGFFIVAGFYLLAGMVLYFFLHQPIKRTVSDLIVRQALK